MTKKSILSKSSKIYHLYWEDRCIMRGVDEEEFHPIWEKLMWVYNTELNFVEITIQADETMSKTDPSNCNPKNREKSRRWTLNN